MIDVTQNSNQLHIDTLRGADDLRRGYPLVVRGADASLRLILPLERADTVTLARFDDMAGPSSELIVTASRANTLKLGAADGSVVRLERSNGIEPEDMAALADPTLDLARPLFGPFRRSPQPSDDLDTAAIQMVKLARLLPAVVIADIERIPNGVMSVDQTLIQSNNEQEASTLEQVANARVPLAGAENCRLIAFRPRAGGLEHIAILVWDPSRQAPVLARIHSECFTGDLLASLKCDCGEQLRGAIQSISNDGGGLVLYLAQEGRGIGLVSKLKAYALQDQGYDTVDANTRLGFDVDERVFAPAAEMIRSLGFSSVRLMTNNPGKIEALERFGVTVTERVEHAFEPNPHNEQYLEVKRAKTGHLLPPQG